MTRRSVVAVLCSAFVLWPSSLGAQAEVVPGEVVEVPILADDAIVVDGDLADWANLPAVETTGGTQPSANPDVAGRLRWQLAAIGGDLLVAATVTDDLIIAGQNGDAYWQEDSVEMYVNLAERTATGYGPGIAQLRISPVDIGNTDPTMLTISGAGTEGFPVEGYVFSTVDGWGFEVAVSMPTAQALLDGESIGFQMQANGSSGNGRDIKVIWSALDTNDTSFEDPSVFGEAVFVEDPGDDGASNIEVEPDAEPSVEPPAVAEDDAESGGDTAADETGVAVSEPDVDEGAERRRALLIAAAISAVTVAVGGVWFERRRKRSEERLALERGDEGDRLDEDYLDSILDD